MTNQEIIEELISIQTSTNERFERLIESVRGNSKSGGFDAEPVGYHREQDERERQEGKRVLCNCGLPAVRKSGSKNGRDWAGYFCNRPKDDLENCGFRKWE